MRGTTVQQSLLCKASGAGAIRVYHLLAALAVTVSIHLPVITERKVTHLLQARISASVMSCCRGVSLATV